MTSNSPSTPLSPPPAPTVPEPGRTSRLPAKNYTEIEFPGKVPGNNGAGGLLRLHWRLKTALSERYLWRVRLHTAYKHPGPVRLELVRFSTGRHMDYDNLVSTGKLLIDAIVKAGVLPDDNPAVIVERTYTQQRAESKEKQRTVITITDL